MGRGRNTVKGLYMALHDHAVLDCLMMVLMLTRMVRQMGLGLRQHTNSHSGHAPQRGPGGRRERQGYHSRRQSTLVDGSGHDEWPP